ncbi:hypothetical protein LJ656_15080 [Paraburkholderia sp. MMS20-SJTR3]|uniref:Uncharacterized protein n=1 Tax=Paraburkholderia sejongensis TaxID=2886946 RepID=A0ABS8JVL0_9BURK|nr:hypothetical protein [Paraburkholderia sp. MMS20-SJTR3]MCC8393919.1 hypothetical protein [Paraburkholderia sp. MMS20-SJTR3]
MLDQGSKTAAAMLGGFLFLRGNFSVRFSRRRNAISFVTVDRKAAAGPS